MIEVTHIFDQGNLPACQSFAVATLVTALTRKEVDAVKLFNMCNRGGMGTNLPRVLDICCKQGVPMVDGTIQKVTTGMVNRNISDLRYNIDRHGGIVVSYDLYDKDPIERRIDTNGMLCRRPWSLHAMAITDYTEKAFTFINSWGANWGTKGKMFVPPTLMSMDFLKQAYYIDLLK